MSLSELQPTQLWSEAWKNLSDKGEVALLAWVRDGLLVTSARVAVSWSMAPSVLFEMSARGELFELQVAGEPWLPAAYLVVPPVAVAEVNQTLRIENPVAVFIFWMCPHGALGARTIGEALRGGVPLTQVVELARRWAEEHVWLP